jgi:hypothetical protein
VVSGMRILVINQPDMADVGVWSSHRWDLVVDLGRGGAGTYERWSKRFGCRVEILDSFRKGSDDFRRVRDLLGRGCGKLIDEYGLDWWEIMLMLLHEEMEALILLRRFAQTISASDEVYISRPGFHADLLHGLLGAQVHVFPLPPEARKGLRYFARLSGKLSRPQILEVFWDKYDSGYQLRGRLARRRPLSTRPVVLVPTAYVNVSRTGAAYANTFPEGNFLLVTTRPSGWIEKLPGNVSAAWLSSYASVRDRSKENAEIESRWRSLRNELEQLPEFRLLDRLGYLDAFPQRFRRGFEVRDAWRNVLDREPVQAVLCADDSNPYTRIPLLLARERGLANIACHHGALDCSYAFKHSYADVILAKGRMEEDYLVRVCGVPRENVETAAPSLPAGWNLSHTSNHPSSGSHILFVSEAAEVSGGRPEEFYRDVLPPLADLALASGRLLIVKLHPQESKKERSAAVARILSTQQKAVTRIVTGPLTEDLLAKAWFGITILSTVATECAVRRIPCFLCKWLEFWPYRYVEQFIRFGAAIGLDHPSDIAKIPQHLRQPVQLIEPIENWWQPIAPGRLQELLTSSRKEFVATRDVARMVGQNG